MGNNMFGEDRYHRMDFDFDYETPEWLEWIIELQTGAWSAFYSWVKGLLELIKAKDYGGILGYMTESPLMLYNYIAENDIEFNAISALYVSSLILLWRGASLFSSLTDILKVAYKIIAPVVPDYLAKYIPLWILRSAIYYIIIVLEVVSLVWAQSFGWMTEIGSQVVLMATLPYLLAALIIWNWRMFICDSEGAGTPWLNNVPGGDALTFVTGPLLCWLPYFNTVTSFISEWTEWLANAGAEAAGGLIKAFETIVNLIKNIIGGIGSICDVDIGNKLVLREKTIEITAGKIFSETILGKKIEVPNKTVPIVTIPEIRIPSIPLAAAVGGKNGAFCTGLDKGKQDMKDYLVEVVNARCKVRAWKNKTKCGAYKCNLEAKYEGAQDALDKCEDPTGYAEKVEARRAEAAERKRIAELIAAAKKKADAKAAAKRARMMSVGRGTPYWHIYNTNNKIYMSLQPSTHNPIVRKMYRGNGTGNGAGVNDTRVVIRDEDGNALGVGKLKVNTPYYIQSVNSSGAWLGCDQPTGSSKVLKTVKIDDARKFEFTGGKNNRIKLSGYAGYNMHAGSTQLGNKWYAKKSITGTTTFNLWWATNGGFQEIQMTKEEEAAAAKELQDSEIRRDLAARMSGGGPPPRLI